MSTSTSLRTEPAIPGMLSLHLRHALDLSILAFVVVSILAFPVIFQKAGVLWSALERTGWYSSPLPLKECLSLVFIPIILGLFLARAVATGWIEYLRSPLNPILAAAACAVLIFTFIAPSVHLAWRDALLTIGHILFFFVLCTRTKDRRFRRLLYGTLCICGFLAALTAFLQTQKIYLGFLIGSQDPRQFMASTFGHNNGVAAFLVMITLHMIGLGVAWRNRNRWFVRALILVVVGFNIYLIMISGTRASWGGFVIGAVIFYFVLIGFRRRLRQWRKQFLLQSLATVGLSMAILVSFLFITGFDQNIRQYVAPRIEATGNAQWMIENARPRLARISLDMVADHPVTGLGFAGFKMEYPYYQASYFSEHPKSPLLPTDRHSDQVHNEWIQIWTEFGVLGLMAVFYFAGLLVWYAFRVVQRWRNDQKTIQFLAAFAATVALSANNLLSFEFHVQPNALTFLIGLALMAGLDGHTRFRGFSLAGLARVSELRFALVAALILAALLAGIKPVLWSIGDSYYAWGNAMKGQADSARQRGDLARRDFLLANAVNYIDKARKLAPYYGFYAYNLAQVKSYMVAHNIPMKDEAGKIRQISSDEVIADLREAERTWRYKGIHHMIAQMRILQLSQNSAVTPELRAQWSKEAEENLELAADIYHLDPIPRYDLARMKQNSGDREGAVKQFERVREIDSGKLREYLERDLNNAFRSGNVNSASVLIDTQYRLFPSHWPYVFSKALAFWEYEKDKDSAIAVVMDYHKRMEGKDKKSILGVVTLYERFGDLDKAEETLLNSFAATDINEEVALMYLYMDDFLRRTGQGARLPGFWHDNLSRQKILGPKAKAYVYVRLGRLHLAMGDLDRARWELAESYRANDLMKKSLAYQESIEATRLLPLLLTQ